MNISAPQDRSRFIKKIIFWSIIVGGLIALLFMPTKAFALETVSGFLPIVADAKPINVCESLGGCLPGAENPGSGREAVAKVVIDVSRFLIYVAVVVAVLFIVFAAYRMITGGTEGFKTGREILFNAVIGLVVAIVSLTIVNIIAQILPTLDILQ